MISLLYWLNKYISDKEMKEKINKIKRRAHKIIIIIIKTAREIVRVTRRDNTRNSELRKDRHDTRRLLRPSGLTCRDDVEDTGPDLLPDGVLGPAEKRPVVQFRHGRVRNDAESGGRGEPPRRHVDRVGRVVEGPLEALSLRIGRYTTRHFGVFEPRHAVSCDLAWRAHRGVCRREQRRGS